MSDLLVTAGPASKVKDYIGPKGIAFKEIIPRRERGAPTVMTPEVLRKLEDAFMHAFTDKEACLYANISKTALYEYCERNPDFAERKETLKITPNLAAKRELVVGIKGSVDQSRWWAQHKMSDEFAPKSKIEHSGGVSTTPVPMTPEIQAVVSDFNAKLREAIAAPHTGPKQV